MNSLKMRAYKNPNQVGELLRNEFFLEGTWDFQEDVKNQDISKAEHYNKFTGDKEINGENIHCHWYWYDDYFLEFTFDDGSNLLNEDAKKDYNWLWIDRRKIK